MVKNNQHFVRKTFLYTQILKTFAFFGQKLKKKNCHDFHVFLGAFTWNHPIINSLLLSSQKIIMMKKIVKYSQPFYYKN